MHNGHRGINHPVKNLLTGKGEITSQNHGFAINRAETEANPNVEITHLHLNDDTVAGIKIKGKNTVHNWPKDVYTKLNFHLKCL